MQKGIGSSLYLHIHKPKNLPRVLQKKQPSSYMLSHHTWSPRAPLINVVAQCMPASEPKWLFFWRPFEAKRCNNIELGERGHASFFAMSLTGWLFFLKNPDSVRERFFGLRMCKHKLEQTTFCTCHNLNPNTLSSSKLLPNKQRSTIFFCLWLCKRKLEQIPFCTCHNPNPKTRSSSQLLPTNKECASTPPEAELHKLCFAQCTYSARTVHGTVHATVHGHKTL